MEEIEVTPGCEGEGLKIGDVRGGAIIVALRRPDGMFVAQPGSETELHVGDVLVAMGTARTMDRLEALFAPPAGARDVVNPVAELRAAVEAAAGALREGDAAPGTRADARAPAQARVRRLLHQRGDAARADARPAAARDRPAPGGGARREAARRALERFEVAGPGFVNLFLADDWHRAALEHVVEAGDAFGAGGAAQPEKILVEFVSANPTGPAHAGHARNAAYGDALGADPRVRRPRGHARVLRQRLRLAGRCASASPSRRGPAGEEVAEDGYEGDYIAELAAEIPDAATRDVARVRAGCGGAHARAHAREPARVRRRLRRLVLRGLAARRRRPRGATQAFADPRAAGQHLPLRGRAVAAHDRRSATTRTACSSAPRASTPTSPRTSPTTRTSASAASTGSSTSGAPTTTATCSA